MSTPRDAPAPAPAPVPAPATAPATATAGHGQKGSSLVESLVTLFLIQVGLLAVVPLFVTATRVTASAGAMGRVGAVAVARFEQLRSTAFNNAALDAGTYTDNSQPGVTVTWTISNDAAPPDTHVKEITVRARSTKVPIGKAKEIVLRGKRAR